MSGSVELYERPGPKASVRHLILTIISAILAVLVLLWIVLRLKSRGQLTEAKWSPFLSSEIWTEYLIPGLLGTLGAAVVAIVIAMTVGVLLGVGRLSQITPIRVLCSAWVEFFRSIPVLMLMLFAYGGLIATQAVQSEYYALTAVIVGLVLYNSAVVAELVRSGVSSLPSGQREAGRAVGLREGQLMFSILLPQALTAMLPSLISQLVVVLKDTALGYVIGYEELLRKAEQIGTYKANVLPALIVVAAMFITVNWSLTIVASKVEKKLNGRRSPGGVSKKAKPKAPTTGSLAKVG